MLGISMIVVHLSGTKSALAAGLARYRGRQRRNRRKGLLQMFWPWE